MKGATYTNVVLHAAYEIEALMQLQLVALAMSDEDCTELFALRGMAMRVSELATIVMEAMSDIDVPKSTVAHLRERIYGSSGAAVVKGGAA